MGALSGRYASVKLGTSLVRGIGKWDLDMSRKEADTTEFGSTWEKSEVGMGKWKASFSGFMDLDDGQQTTLRQYFADGTLITDIRFYLSELKYYHPDILTDPDAGCRIDSLKVGQSKDGVASVDISVSGSGPLTIT